MADHLDPESFPFTENELRRAVELRVEELLAGWREQSVALRRGQLMYEHGHHPNAEPTSAVQAILEMEQAAHVAEWESIKARVEGIGRR